MNRCHSNQFASSAWVSALGQELTAHYAGSEANIHVFYRGNPKNHKSFRLQEYLYDITVLKAAKVTSPRGKVLEYPIETLWHIESEFNASDTRATVIDFGKLQMSAAENLLLILPAGGTIEQWATQSLPGMVRPSGGNFHVCFVPHPGQWNQSFGFQPIVKRLSLARSSMLSV